MLGDGPGAATGHGAVNHPRERKAWAIFGPRREWPHLDKVMASPAECWGLLGDELHDATGTRLLVVDMSRLGYSCRRVTLRWDKRK
jgi:hypothetical protein